VAHLPSGLRQSRRGPVIGSQALGPFARRATTKFVGERCTMEAQASAMVIFYREEIALQMTIFVHGNFTPHYVENF
jgi:hypothetical protein